MYKTAAKFVIAIVISFLIPSQLSLQAQNSRWTSNGPDGGQISCLTISPTNPEIMYAGTKFGIYKTLNAGVQWSRTNFPVDYEVTSIQVHATDPDLVMVGTFRSGLYRTENGGKSWIFDGLWGSTINCLDRDPSDPEILYLGTGECMARSADFIAINRLSDHWKKRDYLIRWDNWDMCGWSQVNRILVDPDSSNLIYAAGINSGYCSNYGGILISQDTGSTWTDIDIATTYGDDVSNIELVKNSQGKKTLLAITGGSPLSSRIELMKSPDMGESWEEVEIPYDGTINPNVVLAHPGEPGTVIIGSTDPGKPLWLFTEETGEWDFIAGSRLPPAISPTCAAGTLGDEPSWYLATLYGGIYMSTGMEGRWDQINAGINNCWVNDFVVNPDNPSDVYAATYESLKLAHSSDGGKTWEIQPSNLSSSFDVLSLDPNHPSTFWAAYNSYATGGYKLFKAEEYGQYWTGPYDFINTTPTSNRTEITDIMVKPGDSNTLFVTSQPWFMSTGLTGFGMVGRTIDGGSTWNNYPYSGACLAMDPAADHDKVYVGKGKAGQVFLLEFEGNSTTFSNVEPEEGIEDVQDIAFDQQGNYFVATSNGLWRVGETGWDSLVCLADNITTLAMDHSKTPSVLYAGSKEEGVFLSDDSGENWMPYNNGLTNLAIANLEISGQMIYASAHYGGIWSRPLPEKIAPPYLTHRTRNMEMSVFQNGSIGHNSPHWTYGDGITYNSNMDALFYGGLFLGSPNLGVANGFLGGYYMNNDFQNTLPMSGFTSFPGQWDQVSFSAFDDLSSPSPLGIKVVQRSYTNSDSDILILSYMLEHKSGPVEGLYAGIFADWDVGGGDYCKNNLGGFDLSRNMAYQYLQDGNPDPGYYGIVALNGLSGTRIRNQCNSLYVRDSSLVWMSTINETEIEEPDDLKTWIGSGPFAIGENESLHVCFAIVAGANLTELQENADLAAERYLELPDYNSMKETPFVGFCLEQNAPNPFSGYTVINYSVPYPCDVLIEVFNAQGMKVKSLQDQGQTAGLHSTEIRLDGLENGIYFYTMKANNYSKTRKMVLY
ncbi:MAG: T9SS type A sorting domain-containing protein [Bacteroidales bacterium]